MKKFIFILFILLCFSVGIFAQRNIEDKYNNVPTVSYCELLKQPELYNGKMIRVHGIYEREFEKSAFYDNACFEDSSNSRIETWLWDFSKLEKTASGETLEILKTFNSGKGGSETEVTLIGTFNGSQNHGGFGHLNQYKFQIKVSRFEQAKLLPVEKYGCKRIDETKPFHYLSYVKTEIGKIPNYENDTKKQKQEELVWIRLSNNSTCSITVPIILNEADNQQLKDQSEVPVLYELSSRCTTRKSKLSSDQKPILSTLLAGNSIYFVVPLRYLNKESYDIRVAFNFLTQKADKFYQPFYFSQYDLPENLRKDIDCRKF